MVLIKALSGANMSALLVLSLMISSLARISVNFMIFLFVCIFMHAVVADLVNLEYFACPIIVPCRNSTKIELNLLL